ncbi:MAG: hypothetical protein H6964_00175 [Chromatiaceae bacterium]|nr:hypothetical protein [Gammaproteobacteria bacterium]MCB1871550.1 hypothetical protein [Gammaproteobacteria bacterium]MCB1902517.1 hypothetical protein [Gammaproteobacteria bacterium]MCP5445402.1 hypothetical protein [Chromatiaceae bacterium]
MPQSPAAKTILDNGATLLVPDFELGSDKKPGYSAGSNGYAVSACAIPVKVLVYFEYPYQSLKNIMHMQIEIDINLSVGIF